MPTYDTSDRYGLRALTGANRVKDIDDGIAALRDDVSNKLTPHTSGPLSARPTSTSGTPGIAGRTYRATVDDSGTPINKLFIDTGAGWLLVPSRQAFIDKSVPAGAYTRNSSNQNNELHTSLRCSLPAMVGDLIESDVSVSVATPSNITNIAFATLNDTNTVVSVFPPRGSFNAFFRSAGYSGSIDGTAKRRLSALDIRADGTVCVTVVVHTGGQVATFGDNMTSNASLLNLGQVG